MVTIPFAVDLYREHLQNELRNRLSVVQKGQDFSYGYIQGIYFALRQIDGCNPAVKYDDLV